jgi:hypothetical protein
MWSLEADLYQEVGLEYGGREEENESKRKDVS